MEFGFNMECHLQVHYGMRGACASLVPKPLPKLVNFGMRDCRKRNHIFGMRNCGELIFVACAAAGVKQNHSLMRLMTAHDNNIILEKLVKVLLPGPF